MPVADLAHLGPEAARWNVRHRADRLGDESSDITFAAEYVIDHAGADGARFFRRNRSIRAAIARKGRDVFGARHERPNAARAEQRLAAHCGGAEARAVKGIPERQRLVPAGFRTSDLDRK